jgi:DnaJ-class molecular chaperone
MNDTPQPCSTCNGTGRVWRYRIDDRVYPAPCPKCGGKGIA